MTLCRENSRNCISLIQCEQMLLKNMFPFCQFSLGSDLTFAVTDRDLVGKPVALFLKPLIMEDNIL